MRVVVTGGAGFIGSAVIRQYINIPDGEDLLKLCIHELKKN